MSQISISILILKFNHKYGDVSVQYPAPSSDSYLNLQFLQLSFFVPKLNSLAPH